MRANLIVPVGKLGNKWGNCFLAQFAQRGGGVHTDERVLVSELLDQVANLILVAGVQSTDRGKHPGEGK